MLGDFSHSSVDFPLLKLLVSSHYFSFFGFWTSWVQRATESLSITKQCRISAAQVNTPVMPWLWLSVWILEIFVVHGTIFIQRSLELESHARNFLLLWCHTWFLHSSCVTLEVSQQHSLSWQQEQELCSLSMWVINRCFWELLSVSVHHSRMEKALCEFSFCVLGLNGAAELLEPNLWNHLGWRWARA